MALPLVENMFAFQENNYLSGNIMNEPGAGSHRKNVQENAYRTAEYPIDIAKEQLGRHFPWGDIEQVGGAETMQDAIQNFGCQTEKGKKRQCLKEASGCKIGFVAENNDESDKNQHQMPKDAMQCQHPVRMKNTGGVDKGGNSPHHIEIKQKGTENSVPFFVMYHDQQGTQIHGETAKLKWKNPPVINVVIDNIKIHQLFI